MSKVNLLAKTKSKICYFVKDTLYKVISRAHDLIHMDEVKNFNWLFYDNHILCTLTLKYRYGHKYQDVGVCHEIVFNN